MRAFSSVLADFGPTMVPIIKYTGRVLVVVVGCGILWGSRCLGQNVQTELLERGFTDKDIQDASQSFQKATEGLGEMVQSVQTNGYLE